MKIIFKILLYIILILLVIYNSVLVIQKIKSPQDTPNFFGYKNFIISSGSMENSLSVGDVIFVKEDYEINKNDIISFREKSAVVTHRVIDIFEENGEKLYKTQGDANNIPDTRLISKDEIEGKYSFKIAKIGLIIMFFQSKFGIIVLLLIFLLIFVLININGSKTNRTLPNRTVSKKKGTRKTRNEKRKTCNVKSSR